MNEMDKRFQVFTLQIAKISRCIRRIKTEEMAEFDLKSPHVSCLYYLYKFKALTAKELSGICDEDKASISRSIEYLEHNGYLICNSKAEKRYKSQLSLTDKGNLIGKQLVNKIDNILNLAGNGLSEENRKIFYSSLILISNNLEKICNKYKKVGK